MREGQGQKATLFNNFNDYLIFPRNVFAAREIQISSATSLVAYPKRNKPMKNAELKSLEQSAPQMSLDELDKLAKELRSLLATVSSEQRKHRGQRGAGVLGVNGRIYS